MSELKSQLTLPVVIQLATLLIAAAIAFATVSNTSSVQADEIKDHETRIRTIETQLLTTVTRVDERLKNIEAALHQNPQTRN